MWMWWVLWCAAHSPSGLRHASASLQPPLPTCSGVVASLPWPWPRRYLFPGRSYPKTDQNGSTKPSSPQYRTTPEDHPGICVSCGTRRGLCPLQPYPPSPCGVHLQQVSPLKTCPACQHPFQGLFPENPTSDNDHLYEQGHMTVMWKQINFCP